MIGLQSLWFKMLPLPSCWTHPILNRPLCHQPVGGRMWEEEDTPSHPWESCDESQWSLWLHPMYSWGCTFGSVSLELLGCGYLHYRIQPPGKRISLSEGKSTSPRPNILLILNHVQVKGVSWKKEHQKCYSHMLLSWKNDIKFANNP
jgi:hypothetical protein